MTLWFRWVLLVLCVLLGSGFLNADVVGVNIKSFPEEKEGQVQGVTTDGLYWIPIVSAIGFQLLHDYCNQGLSLNSRRNTTCAPLVHSLITGISSNYLFFTRTEPSWMQIVSEDVPQSYLEIIPPLISWGYSLYELHDSVTHQSVEFFIHGAGMFLGMYYLNKVGKAHLFNIPLITEASQIFYNMRRVDKRFMYPFGLLFFIYRWGIIPSIWLSYVRNVYWNDVRYPEEETISPLWLLGGVGTHVMNVYWGAKILKIIFGEGIR